jgi:membrane-anchored mycosin MYCP
VAVCLTVGLVSCPAVAVAGPVAGVMAERRAGCEPQGTEVAAPAGKVPYVQQRYNFDQLLTLADGAGVRIAVIDSGVDATHPLLRGQVADGKDFLYNTSDGRRDCVGHGTGVASIIAGKPAGATASVPLRGLAPGATIVPVRVSEQLQIDKENPGTQQPGKTIDGKDLADAIDWAVGKDSNQGRATVINTSLTMTEDNTAVRRSIERAIASGVVVVAAVGNQAKDGNPTPYPAAYPGVIGVGSVGADGQVQDYSQRGDYVDIVAPGGQVTAANARKGYMLGSGTSYAAPFVTATVALIRQRFPKLSPAQVERQLEMTADPAPGGRRSDTYGHGILNPYRALTESVADPAATPKQPAPLATEDPAVAAMDRRQRQAQSRGFVYAAAGAGLALLIITACIVIPQGRRRGWRPADS